MLFKRGKQGKMSEQTVKSFHLSAGAAWLSTVTALAILVGINWTVCTNTFGSGNYIVQYSLLIILSGWVGATLASSDEMFVLLLMLFSALFYVFFQLIYGDSPGIYLLIAVAGIVVAALSDVIVEWRNVQSFWIIVAQVAAILFFAVCSTLLFADLVMPSLSRKLPMSIDYDILGYSRWVLLSAFFLIAGLNAFVSAVKKPWPELIDTTSSVSGSNEDPRTISELFKSARETIRFGWRWTVDSLRHWWGIISFLTSETIRQFILFSKEAMMRLFLITLRRVGGTALACVLAVWVTAQSLSSIRKLLLVDQTSFVHFELVIFRPYICVILAYLAGVAIVSWLAIVWETKNRIREAVLGTSAVLLIVIAVAQYCYFFANMFFEFHPIFFRSFGLFMLASALIVLVLLLRILRLRT